MDPSIENLVAYRNATFTESYQINIGPNLNTLAPLNLTGCTVVMELFNPLDGSSIFLFDSSLGDENMVITDAVGGAFAIYLPPSEVTALSFKIANYTLTVHYSDGNSDVFIRGTFAVQNLAQP